MLKDKEQKLNKYPTIEEQKEQFKSFSLLPLIIGVCIAVFGAVCGISMAITARSAGAFFAWAGGGAIVGALTYAILKILISSQVLSVLYLENISKSLEEMKSNKMISETNVSDKNEEPVIESILGKSSDTLIDNEEPSVVSTETTSIFQPSQEEIKFKAIVKLEEITEIDNKEEFFITLQKWQEKYGNKLLYWDLTLYNKIGNFFNETEYSLSYDSQMEEHRTYKIEDENYKNMVLAIKEFCDRA